MESAIGRKTCSLVKSRHRLRQLAASPRYERCILINNEFAFALSKKPEMELKRPTAIAFAILELSKFIVQRYFYEILPSRIPGVRSGMRLCLTDTDSLLIATNVALDEDGPGKYVNGRKRIRGEKAAWPEIENMDYLNYLGPDVLDRSNFCKTLSAHTDAQKSQGGLLKLETGSQKIISVCSLRAKCYCVKVFDNEKGIEVEKIGCKGIAKSVIRRQSRFDTFRNVLMGKIGSLDITSQKLQAASWSMYRMRVSKRALVSFEDKRKILHCGIHSIAHNHALVSNGVPFDDIECNICEKEKRRRFLEWKLSGAVWGTF